MAAAHARVEWLSSLIESNELRAVAHGVLGLHIDRLVSLIDTDELVLDILVVRHVGILELIDIVKDILDLLNILCLNPKQSFW